MTTPSTELSLLPELPTKEAALLIFKSPNGLDPFIKHVRDQVALYPVVDIGTAKGRKELASQAFAITKSKTALDNLGKLIVDDLKGIPKLVDAHRKLMRDDLDKLAATVRQPLTDWEAAEVKRQADEAARKAKLEAAIIKIGEQGNVQWGMSAEVLRERLARVETVHIDPQEWGDLAERAKQVCAQALANLKTMLAEREAFEQQQLDLELERAKLDQQALEAAASTAAIEPAAQLAAQPEGGYSIPAGELENRPATNEAQGVTHNQTPVQTPSYGGSVRSAGPTTEEAAAADAMMKISGINPTIARIIIKAIVKGSIPHIKMY